LSLFNNHMAFRRSFLRWSCCWHFSRCQWSWLYIFWFTWNWR